MERFSCVSQGLAHICAKHVSPVWNPAHCGLISWSFFDWQFKITGSLFSIIFAYSVSPVQLQRSIWILIIIFLSLAPCQHCTVAGIMSLKCYAFDSRKKKITVFLIHSLILLNLNLWDGLSMALSRGRRWGRGGAHVSRSTKAFVRYLLNINFYKPQSIFLNEESGLRENRSLSSCKWRIQQRKIYRNVFNAFCFQWGFLKDLHLKAPENRKRGVRFP